MPVACSFETRARGFRSLASTPFANRLLGGPLHRLTLQHVQSRLPAGLVREVNQPENPAFGWLDAGGVVVNTARSPRADTPLHELTHLWLLMLRAGKTGDLGLRYDELSRQLTQDPTYQALAKNYPLTATYRYSDQQQEVTAMLVGQLAARRAALSSVPVLGRLLRVAEQLVGRYLGLEGHVLSKPLYAVVSALADDILQEGVIDVDPEWLRQHVQFARYQGMDVPTTARDFLSRVAGVGTGVSERQLKEQSKYAVKAIMAGAVSVPLPSLQGGNDIEPDMTHLTQAQRLDEVHEHFRQLAASAEALAGDGALTLLNLPTDQLGKILAGDWDALPAHPGYSKDQLKALAQELGKAFYDVQPQDTIAQYSEAALPPGVYDPTFDDGLTVLHIKPRRSVIGTPLNEVVVVRLASNGSGSRAADLTTKVKDAPLLSGLYSGTWLGAAKGWANKKLYGMTMTGSFHNRAMLSGTALALHLTDKGYHVTGVGVGKIDLQSAPDVQHNDVRLVPVTEFLSTWESLGKIADLKEMLPPRIKELLTKPKLLETLTYEQDYIRSLSQYAEGKSSMAKVVVALGEYEAGSRQNSARGLIKAIENRLSDLRNHYGENQEAFKKSREVLILGQAHAQLQGIMPLANKHADLGALERFWRGFNAGDSPYLQWFYEQWAHAREASTDKFLIYQRDRMRVTEALMEDAHKRGGLAYNVVYHDEAKYYEPLFVISTQVYTDKNGQERPMEFNEHRFKMPGTEAYKALSEAQRNYIDWALATTKQLLIDRFLLDNANGKEPGARLKERAAKWYADTWGRGYAPVIPGNVTQHLFGSVKGGELNGQLLGAFQKQLDENLVYDQQANSNQDTLSDKFGMQGGKTEHGSDARLEQLGLLAVQELVDGKLQTKYVIDPEQGRVRNLSLEPNFQRTLDQFVMSNLKHQQATDLQTKKLTAVAMIRAGFKQSGLLRGTQERNEDGTDAEATSNTEKYLETMYASLVLGQRNQMIQSEGIRRLGYWLAAGGKVASVAALGFSVKTAAASQVGNIFNALDVGLANLGQEHGLTLPTMMAALADFKDLGKLIAIARQERTFDMDEFSLIEEYTQNGRGLEGVKASDFASGKESFFLDRFGDMAIRLWLTAAQMRQNGTWEAYSYNKADGTLTYSETAHREKVGDAVVNAIQKRMLETGELELDAQGNPAVMKRANDNRMRASIEAFNTDVLGPYKEEVGTIMGSNIFLRMVQKFRVYALKRIDDWFKGDRVNINKGYRDKETGEWVSTHEVGLFNSFGKLLGGTMLQKGMIWKTWNELTPADRYNLKRCAAATTMTMAALLLADLAFGDDDEEEKKKRTLSEHVLHSLVQDQWLVSQMGVLHQAITSPMVAISFIDRMQAAFGDYLTGDLDSGNRIMHRNLGVFKTWDWMAQVFGVEQEKEKKTKN